MKRFPVLLAAWLSFGSTALAAPSLTDPNLSVAEITSGLSAPTTMEFIGADDILVLQKDNGQVRRIIGGVLQPGVVLDVAVDNASERGNLGIAVHPNFPVSPFVYLYYTESSSANDSFGSPAANRVYRYTWDGAALISPVLILDLPVLPGPNHDGGVISFGPDGKLYVVIGDLNRDGQLQNFTRRTSSRRYVGDSPRQRRWLDSERQSVFFPRRQRGEVLRLRHTQFLRHGLRSGDQQTLDDGERSQSFRRNQFG